MFMYKRDRWWLMQMDDLDSTGKTISFLMLPLLFKLPLFHPLNPEPSEKDLSQIWCHCVCVAPSSFSNWPIITKHPTKPKWHWQAVFQLAEFSFSLSLSLSRFLSSSLPGWHFSGRSSTEIPPCLVAAFPQPASLPGQSGVAEAGWDGAPPELGPKLRLQPTTHSSSRWPVPPATRREVKRRRDRGLVVVCFRLTAAVLHQG